MDVTKMTPQELGEQMQAIVAGKLKGVEAAHVLRAAVQIYQDGQDQLRNLDSCIQHAESVLVYGDEGRPTKNFGSSWGAMDNALANERIAKTFSIPQKFDDYGMPISGQ